MGWKESRRKTKLISFTTSSSARGAGGGVAAPGAAALAFGRWHTEGSTEAEGPEGSKNEKASIHGNLRGPQHPPMPPSPPRSKGDPKKA